MGKEAKMQKDFVAVTPENLQEFTKQDGIVFLTFSAGWCAPCRVLKAALHKIVEMPEYQDLHVGIVSLDNDINAPMAAGFSITAIPRTFVLKDGVKVAELYGSQSEADLVKFLKNLTATAEGAPLEKTHE